MLHDLAAFGSGGPDHDHTVQDHTVQDHTVQDHTVQDHTHQDHAPRYRTDKDGPLRVGIGGPVGSGKTSLVIALCAALQPRRSVAVVTNDIFTREDAAIVARAGVLADDRLTSVQTGCCPHTAIRDDIAANEDAIAMLEARHQDLDVVLLESGGDNLTATFSPRLVDVQFFVIDVAGGDKVPRKGGPGITRSDLLVINKTDLAPLVKADLAVMARDAARVRDGAPTVMLSLVADPAASEVVAFIEGRLCERR